MSASPPCVRLPLLWLLLVILVAGCSFGPRRVPSDRFNYNRAIGQSANEQMLLNLVRLRYRDVPVFLAVNSVLTQYVYTGGGSVATTFGRLMGDSVETFSGSGSLRYIERPTITYTPLMGDALKQQLLNPVRSELLFSLLTAGWPAEKLLRMTLQRVNTVRNVPFGLELGQLRQEELRRFDQLIHLFVQLARLRAIEMQSDIRPGEPEGERFLVFAQDTDPATAELIQQLRELLDLDPGISRFRVVRHTLNRAPDEITIINRSLLTLMAALAQSIDLSPEDDSSDGESAEEGSTAPTARQGQLLSVQTATRRPRKSFVAVEYEGLWFHIPQADEASKESFGLLTYLFLLQAPQAPSAGPLVTVPTG